jgi:hypothetical protein
MPNHAQRARFWINIICSRCHYPAPERLRAQFEAAELSDFCGCGCNSFGVSLLNPEIPPVCGPHSRYGAFFEASFYPLFFTNTVSNHQSNGSLTKEAKDGLPRRFAARNDVGWAWVARRVSLLGAKGRFFVTADFVPRRAKVGSRSRVARGSARPR